MLKTFARTIIGSSILMAAIVSCSPRSFAGGDESTWGVPQRRAWIQQHWTGQVATPAPEVSIRPVVQSIPTVPILVDANNEPVCDDRHQMFAGRSDLYWTLCAVTPAEATAEPSPRNSVSPQ